MLFCIGDGKYESKGDGYQKNNRVFNIEVSPEEFSKIYSSVPKIKLPITKWIEEENMTITENNNNENYKSLGGYLKTLSYKDAWSVAWEEMNQETKDKFLSIPHFNKDIFEKITGIKIDEDIVEMTVSEVCKALGKNIKIIK